MYIDAGEVLRVRVELDEFYDDEPGPPKATEGVQQAPTEQRRPPYSITVSSLHMFANCGWLLTLAAVLDCRTGLGAYGVVEERGSYGRGVIIRDGVCDCPVQNYGNIVCFRRWLLCTNILCYVCCPSLSRRDSAQGRFRPRFRQRS